MTTSSSQSSPHPLVVDDDEGNVALARHYFGTHGFRVSAATDEAGMRRVLAGEALAPVLLDMGLPGEDGLDLSGNRQVPAAAEQSPASATCSR